MTIEFVSCSAQSSTGPGSVLDLGTVSTFAWWDVVLAALNGNSTVTLEYSVDNTTWVSLGNATGASSYVNGNVCTVAGPNADFTNPLPIQARYLRANVTATTGATTATIVVNG